MNEPADPPQPTIAFGPFVLDAGAARLSRDGIALDVPPRPFALLSHLTRQAGLLVTKDGLLDAVWGHRHVSESVLKGTVNTLRAAMGDDAKAPRWIETVPRRGYRFIGTVAPVAAPADSAATVATEGNLPPASSPLVDREAELIELQALLATHRLVTLSGSGGIGKTRLALALASAVADRARFPDGVWLVRLDALTDSQPLVATIARTLQLSAETARSPQTLAAALRTMQLLLVLDNCEHMLDAIAPLVQLMLAQAGKLRVLATSQEPLRVDAEQVFRVSSLPLPPPGNVAQAEHYGAVALFVQRLRSRSPEFALDDANRQAVCDICTALDGLPLALELAAARVPLLGLDGVRARLQERLALLTQSGRDAAPRHRTLRATLAWSHGLLSPEQRVVLRRLGVFTGTFSLEAAQAVVADSQLDGWGVIDALTALVDKSLLLTTSGGTALAQRRRSGEHAAPSAAPPAPRLRMFDSIRSFAAEQLDAAGELEATRTRHARWVLGVLGDAQRDAHDMMTLEWTAKLLPEVENLRVAMRHAVRAEPVLAVELFAQSIIFWHRAGLKHEAMRWNEAVRGLGTASMPAPVRAGFKQAQAVLCIYGKLVSPADARTCIEEALRLHHAAGDAVNEYFDLYLLAHLMLRTEPQADRTGLWQRMVALEGPDWSLMRRRYSRWLPAQMLRDEGNAEGYRQFCIDEIARLRTVNDRSGIWTATLGLALAEHDFGRHAGAIALLQTTVQDIREAGCLREQPSIVGLLASMLLAQGNVPAGRPAVREAVALLRVDGTLWWMGSALAFAPLWEQKFDDAARVLGWADAMIERRGERPGPFFARLRAGCEARLRQALPAAAMQALLGEGALLEEDAALAFALGR